MLERSVFVYPGQRRLKPQEGAPWRSTGSWGLVHEAAVRTGIDVARLLLDASGPELSDPRLQDLATFVLSMMAYDTVHRHGVRALAHAGHGVGQYSALVAGGVLDYRDAVTLIAERSEVIADVARSTEGSMVVATGIGGDVVDQVCTEAGPGAWVASYNAATETVVAGDRGAVTAVVGRLSQLGARSVPVPAGTPLHTPLMASAAGRFRGVVRPVTFWPQISPVWADVTGTPQPASLLWPRLLCDQLTKPVRWLQTMVELSALGATAVVECGPRPYLSRLARRSGIFPVVIHVGRPVWSPAELGRPSSGFPAPPAGDTRTTAAMLGAMIVNTTDVVGVFTPATDLVAGAVVEEGALVGHVGTTEIRARFAGRVTVVCAATGERIRPHERIAWIAPGTEARGT